MGTGYTRNDTGNNIADGNVINASDLDGEFDAVQAAFNESTGHTHDGTSAEGAPITKLGPAQDVDVGTGAITPKIDNTVDLGSNSLEFKDLYIDGTANIDALVADTADINAGTIDGTVIGGSTPAAATVTTLTVNGNTTLGDAATDTVTFTADVASNVIPSADNTYDLGASGSEWKDLYIDGTANIDSLVADTADINAGTIDGVTIGGAAPGVGTFTTANATTVDATNIEVTNIKAKDGSASATIADSTGVMTIGSAVLTTADINGGTADNVVIGGATAAAGSFTTLNTSGAVVFNDAGADVDFRVEGDTEPNLLFVDASTNRVGVGTNAPVSRFGVVGQSRFYGSGSVPVFWGDTSALGGLTYSGSDPIIQSVGTNLLFNIGATECMRISSAGTLLVGGTTAVGADVSGFMTLERVNGTPSFNIFRNDTSIATNDTLGQIVFYGNDTTSNTPTALALIRADPSGTHSANDNPTDLVFGTTANNTGTVAEKMRLTEAGNLLVGTTNTSPASNNVGGGGFIVSPSGTRVEASLNGASLFNRTSSNGAIIVLYRAGVDVGSIDVTTTATSYNTSSDYRLKENVAPMTGALAKVLELNPVTYTWKADGSAGQGFIAHELQKVAPYAVSGEKDGEEMQGVDYGKITPLLTAALQEAITEIQSLKARVAKLEAK